MAGSGTSTLDTRRTSTVAPAHSRLWYGKLRLAPVEAVAASYPIGIEDLPRRIHARVADTNTILDQLVASVRRPKTIALMSTIHDGGLRLHVVSTIPAEVEEKILDDRDMLRRYERHGITSDVVLARWQGELLPRLRIVDVGEPDLEELAAVAAADPDDLPTAALAAILGPGSTWSSDPDLTDPGLAEPYVLELVIAIREVCVMDVRIVTTAERANLLIGLGTELARAVRRLDARGQIVAAGVVLTGLAAAAIVLRRNPELRRGLTEVLEQISQAVYKELADGYSRREAWADRVPGPLQLDTPRPERAIARALASAPAPRTSEEIEIFLRGSHPELHATAIARELRGYPMFVRAGRGLWQFGQAVDERR